MDSDEFAIAPRQGGRVIANEAGGVSIVATDTRGNAENVIAFAAEDGLKLIDGLAKVLKENFGIEAHGPRQVN